MRVLADRKSIGRRLAAAVVVTVVVGGLSTGPVVAVSKAAKPAKPAQPAKGATSTTPSSVKGEQVVLIEAGPVRYQPRVVRVVAGRPVVFRITNTSALAHEALLGTENVQNAHAKEMKAMAGMSMPHSSAPPKAGEGFVEIKAKGTGEIRTTFRKPGRTILGCHLPGHYEGGMRLTVIVTPPSLG
jgi:uncharacterized cupredoxin-like copper-binding protein